MKEAHRRGGKGSREADSVSQVLARRIRRVRQGTGQGQVRYGKVYGSGQGILGKGGGIKVPYLVATLLP